MNLRRLAIKRGLTALVGGAVAVASGRPVGSTPYYGDSLPTTASAAPSPDGETRNMWAEIFYKQRRKLEREQHLRYRSYNEIDPDLSVLHSTSHAWRAGVMFSRHKARQSVIDEIQDRIDAIWQKPLSYLQGVIGNWLRGNA